MRKRLLIGILFLAFINSRPVSASSAYHLSQKKTPEGICYILTGTKSYSGKITEDDLDKSLEYGGRKYRLVSADMEYRYGTRGQKNPKKQRTETILLYADKVAEIPQYKIDGDLVYILDESSVQMEPSDYAEAVGAEALSISRRLEGLLDNDLSRIPMEVTEDGLSYELISVSYTASSKDAYGVPKSYTAECEYSRLEEYIEKNPVSWQAKVKYDAYQAEECVISSLVKYSYQCIVSAETEEKKEEPARKEAEEAEILPSGSRIWRAVPLAASAGTFLVMFFCISSFTAPIYALTAKGRYQYIGRIRLKKQTDCYEAFLTKYLAERAQVQNYKIRVSNKVQKGSIKGVLLVQCPDNRVLSPKIQKEVVFRLD